MTVSNKVNIVLSDGDDGWIVAEVPSMPGCVSQGKTRAEALKNIREAMQVWKEVSEEEAYGNDCTNGRCEG